MSEPKQKGHWPKGKRRNPAKRASGGARMIESGKKPLTFGLAAIEHDMVRRAAEMVGRPMAQLAKFALMNEAKKILEVNSPANHPQK